jgi:hypothetical protein
VFLSLTSDRTVAFGAGNFTVASDTLFKVGLLTDMNCFPVLGTCLATTPTGCEKLAVAITGMLEVSELVFVTVEGVVNVALPPDINVLRNMFVSLVSNVSVFISLTFSVFLAELNKIGLKGLLAL